MAVFTSNKGKNIPIKGQASKEVVAFDLPKTTAIQPPDFRGLKPRLAAKPGDAVKVGSPIITDKEISGLQLCSPVSGTVKDVIRGDKRALLEIVIEADGKQEAESLETVAADKINSLSKEKVTEVLLKGGLWPVVRQRPFSKIAHPTESPKALFIHAMNTEPLALDVDVVLEGREKDFQVGLDVLSKLTDGKTHLCVSKSAKSRALTSSQHVETHQFDGPHPAGNVSTHIHFVDPINKGDIVWYVEALDVLRVAALFLNGEYPTEKFVAITGEAAKNRVYAKTIEGAPVSLLLKGSNLENARCITGSVLTGRSVGAKGHVGFYDTQISAVPEGGERELLGWLGPGFNKFTFSRAYASAFTGGGRDFSFSTDRNGDLRAIVLNHLYDELIALDIMTYFLLKAVIAGDIEEAEKLGILECDEEDFALATFACPSKTDVGGIIRGGLDLIEKDG